MAITQETHRMEATYQQSGGMVLHCPTCGYRVQVDPTGPNKTLNVGEAATVPHVWALSGDVHLGTEGSKAPRQARGTAGPKRVQMHVAEFGCATPRQAQGGPDT